MPATKKTATARQLENAVKRSNKAQAEAHAAAQSTTAAQQAAPAPAVALRGGPAVQRVQLTGKAYRTGAQHNKDWWAAVQAACAQEPAPVAEIVKVGVPTHFIGYAIRRGYLQAA